MDDQKLIQLIRTGSNDLALKDLYRNFPMIRNLIRSRGGTRKDAEDIFHEALLILLRKATQPEFQLTARLSTYLYSVCAYLWNDQQKRQKPINLDPEDQTIAAAQTTNLNPAEDPDLADAVQRESRIRLAQKALDDLKDRCRELLLLFYQKQLTLKAIANQMGYATEASAKNQKYKCLEAARTRLKELERQQTQTY